MGTIISQLPSLLIAFCLLGLALAVIGRVSKEGVSIEGRRALLLAIIALFAGLGGFALIYFGPSSSRNPNTAQKDALTIQTLFIHAKAEWKRKTKEELLAWADIESQMISLCTKVAPGSCKCLDLSPSNDAEGEFVLIPYYDPQTQGYLFHGYGYYEESIIDDTGTRVFLSWALLLQSKKSIPFVTLSNGAKVDFELTQKGLGGPIPFSISLWLGTDGLIDNDTEIKYKGQVIAHANVTKSASFH